MVGRPPLRRNASRSNPQVPLGTGVLLPPQIMVARGHATIRKAAFDDRAWRLGMVCP